MHDFLQGTIVRLAWLRDSLKTVRRPAEDLSLLLTASLLDLEVRRLTEAMEAENATQTADSDAGL
jgi:hypothetical protein